MTQGEVSRTDGANGRSRRALLKAVAVGGAAFAAAPFVGPSKPAAAADPPLPRYFISRQCTTISPGFPPFFFCTRTYEADLGQIELGGLLVTYASAPLNARGRLTYSMSTTRSETMRAVTEMSRQISVSKSVGVSLTVPSPFGTSRFQFGGTDERIQGSSTRVTDAITHSSTQVQTIETAPVTDGLYNRWEHTGFLIMARPVLMITGVFTSLDNDPPTFLPHPPGVAPVLRFRFVHAGTYFPRSARELRDDAGTRAFIGPETADSILAQYPLRPDQTSGVQLGLGGPRFSPPTLLAPGETPFTFTRSVTGTNTHIVEQSQSMTTRIRRGFTLTLFGDEIFDFQETRSFTTVHTSVQEMTNSQVVTTTGVVSSDLNRLNHIYEDRVWNTLLITDEGPLAGGFATVEGTVTAPDGSPINGAVVTMVVDGLTHEAFTGKDGRYALRLGGDFKPGEYKVTCAGVPRAVMVSRGRTATVDYRRVSAGRARERTR
jgi:hypothetical protein